MPILLFLLSLPLAAQHIREPLPLDGMPRPYSTGDAQRSEVVSLAPAGVAGVGTAATRWANRLVRLSSREHRMPGVAAIKAAKLATKFEGLSPMEEGPQGGPKSVVPQVGSSFEANWTLQQSPPDNAMAISNAGRIVTANNDEVLYMNTSGAILGSFSWGDFFNGFGLNANIYDPKVVYDSQADRFVMTILHGSTASNSLVLLCFSQTNDPVDGWWIYQLPGNVLNNNCWFDYPGLGVSNNEVYVTGNLFTSGNDQFNQAVVYQVQKAQGYAGGNLNYIWWFGMANTPITAFTLQPASWGQQGNYGPGILFVSSAAGGANVVRVWDLTDDLTGNPQFNGFTVNVPAYSPAADAQQQGSAALLDNGDCRIMNTFFLGDRLHATLMTDVGGGWNGIRYLRINAGDLSAQSSNLGSPGSVDLAYPAVASFGSVPGDLGVMVAFTASSGAMFPQARVAYCSADMNWSEPVLVKNGEAFVSFIQGPVERWGDYTGIARRHNAPSPTVWLAACYGANVSGVMNNTWKTWVAEVGGEGSTGLAEEPVQIPIRLYPNPAVDLFQLDLDLPQRTEVRVELLDARGALVKLLHEDTRSPGAYRLSFNRGALAPGTYHIVILGDQSKIGHETLIIH